MDGMVNHNNQAGRLYKILTNAINQPDGATFQIWANVFSVDAQDKTTLFSNISLVQEMTDDVKEKVLNIDGINSSLLLSQHQHIECVVRVTNLDAAWSGYRPQLNLAVMLNLAHCAEALSRYDEIPIDENELVRLDTEIVDLFNKVVGGCLDMELKAIILDMLENIRRSISEYIIRGAIGLRDQLAFCYGKVLQNKNAFSGSENTEEVTSLWSIFARVDNITTVALNLTAIGTTAVNLLSICHK